MLIKKRRLKLIEDEWKDCAKCPAMTNSPIVFGTGNLNSRVMFIGGSPRTDIESEDMFNSVLEAVRIPLNDIWVTNSCLCRVPEVDERSRSPNKKEINNCRPRLKKEINMVKPSIIVLGGNAALFMATGKRGIIKHRGWVIEPDDNVTGVYATLHPSSFFSGGQDQIKSKKKMAWEDWKNIAKVYHGL